MLCIYEYHLVRKIGEKKTREMYWSRINTVDYRRRQGAEMNKDVRSFQAWVGRETEESLGSTEAKRIWKEKFQFGQM